MAQMANPAPAFADLPPTLKAERHGAVAVLRLNRPDKRNALDDAMVHGVESFFAALPDGIGAVVLAGEGEHFSAGLDLTELTERDIFAGVAHSRAWHRAFERIEFGRVPVVAVLHGAVVGGGIEIAAAAHIRVAERSAYYALPEGSRGIFVGGGGSVRLPPLIGTARMMDMMLTGRTLSAEEGQLDRADAISGRRGHRLCQGHGAGASHRRQCAVHQFRRHAYAAAHREQRSGDGLCHRGADVGDRAKRARGEGAAQGLPRQTRAESDAKLDDERRPAQFSRAAGVSGGKVSCAAAAR